MAEFLIAFYVSGCIVHLVCTIHMHYKMKDTPIIWLDFLVIILWPLLFPIYVMLFIAHTSYIILGACLWVFKIMKLEFKINGVEVKLPTEQDPIPMILHCPYCHTQHIDAPEPENGWTNPPHKSHLCHKCKAIWRPSSVATNGVKYIQKGSNDRGTQL